MRTVLILVVSLGVFIVPIHVAHHHVTPEVGEESPDANHHHHHHGGHTHHHPGPDPHDADGEPERHDAGHGNHDHQLKRGSSASDTVGATAFFLFERLIPDTVDSKRADEILDPIRVTGDRVSPIPPRSPPSA